jgi:hypothetical protein
MFVVDGDNQVIQKRNEFWKTISANLAQHRSLGLYALNRSTAFPIASMVLRNSRAQFRLDSTNHPSD